MAGDDSGSTYRRPEVVQVKGRLPRASADLITWAVYVAGIITEPGHRPPSQNTCVTAALETWAEQVLANNPEAARAGLARLTQDPNFVEADRHELASLLHRLELKELVDDVDPIVAASHDGARGR